MNIEKLKFGLASHLSTFESNQLALELDRAAADIQEDIALLQESVRTLRSIFNAAFYGKRVSPYWPCPEN
jgi:hypothetical protein